MGSNEETALAWMNAWLDAYKELPENNMARLFDATVDNLSITKVSKEGLPPAFVFSVVFSVRPTYPIMNNACWMAGNTAESPGRDETWGQMGREAELRMGDDGKYHCVDMGTGGAGNAEDYDLVIQQ